MSFFLASIFTAIFGTIVGYYLLKWTYWRRRGIRGPSGYPVVGNKLCMVTPKNPPSLVYREWTKTYGKTYGVQDGIQQVLITSDPVIVQEVFQKQFENFHERKLFIPNDPKAVRVHVFGASGNRWKRLRTISSPTFTNGNLKKLYGTLENSVLDIMSFIEKNSNGPIHFDTYFQEYTMDVINRIAMGQTESKMFNDPMIHVFNSRFNIVSLAITVINSLLPEVVSGYVDLRVLGKLSGKKHPITTITEQIENAVFGRIKQREKDLADGIELGEPVDFIDLFLDARSDELFDEENFINGNTKVSRQMTTDEIIAQCLVFMVAGFDTTAIALTYTTHLLATHPDVQKKVQEEISRECPDPSIDFDSLTRLKYLDAVTKETLRMFPLASIVNSRKCVNDTVIGGIPIEKGTYVQADTWTMHYDKELWGENAEEWLEGDVNKNNWIPFGHGPRQCIGMRLAIIEEKLLLAHLLRKYTIVPGPETKKLELIGPLVIRPESCCYNVVERD